MEGIMVSIICNVFNHEKFIRNTLESFIAQKTDFSFEVLVHDDCSKDNSTDIIHEYESKYPSIIKAIYQKENQFSKGISINRTFQYPRAKGKYIAICEGDDCWIDCNKIQKQVDYMESHPDCTFCFTNGVIKNIQNGKTRSFIPYQKSDITYIKNDGIYNVVEISRLSFIPTCSFLFPIANIKKYPDYYWERCFGEDRKVSLFATSLGYAYCLNDKTCCYNYGVLGSAMTNNKTKVQIVEIERSFITIYRNINAYTNYRFDEYFNESIIPYLIRIYCLQGSKRLLTDDEMMIVRQNMSIIDWIKRIIFSVSTDKMINIIRNAKRKLCS